MHPRINDVANILSRIYIDLIMQDVADLQNNARMAGLSFKLEKSSGTLVLTMEGYNEKLPVLLQCLVEKMKGLTVDPKQLDMAKQKAGI